MRKAVVLICVLFVSAFSAEAACTIHAQSELTKGGWYRVFWDSVEGASGYHVEILRNRTVHFRDIDTSGGSLDVRFSVASDTTLTYRITAVNDNDPAFEPCSASVDVTLPADKDFRKLTRKLILPVAGSIGGANGARFRTSLKLVETANGQHGRIIFRRAGLLPSDADPSLAWAFTGSPSTPIQYDDVVEAMGQHGIGYLEIVPDEDASALMPRVEARIYNEATEGTFGSLEEAVAPADFTTPGFFTFTVPDPRFRLNIGMVALGPATIIVSAEDGQGHRKASRTMDLLDGLFFLTTARDLLGIDVAPGDVVRLTTLPNGAFIPFYTLTENSTNDPELIIPRQAPLVDVSTAIK